MKFTEYEKALSVPRIGKYCLACRNDKNKALIFYRYNLKLCQKFYGILGVLEVVLRNTVNEHFKSQTGDTDWIISQAQNGFLVNYQETILKAKNELINYTPDRLVASLTLGVWTFMFSRKCYRNSGKTLLRVFPNKTHGLNQADVYRDLNKIREFRNRIAHHESLCFDTNGYINVMYVREIHTLIVQYIDFLGYRPQELLFGVDDPLSTISRIDKLSKTI